MLPSSVRRVAATAPQTPVLSKFGPSASRSAASAVAFSYRRTQNRRYSSSKPSRDNGSEGLPVGQSSAQPAESKASESKTRKRKANTENTAEKHKYPSVPSTSHISPDFLALSSFFSLHRPVSVTRGLPRNVTDDHFASIFTTKSRGAKPSEVLNTLSRTVEDLERPMANFGLQQDAGEQSDGTSSGIDFHNIADATVNMEESVKARITMNVNAMSGKYLPFRPPPLPLPQSETSQISEENGIAAAAEEDQQTRTRTYKAMFTIEEVTDSNGKVNVVAHSPKLIHRSFLDRMALRQIKYEDAQVQRGTMHAISVKRQRKLKMKKHKYKKLMKKQRHERLKHGRT